LLQKKCDYCGQIFQATTPGWCGCPRCGNRNYVMPQQQPSSINPAVLIALGVGGGILMLLIMSVMICCGTIDSDSDSGDSISGSNRTAASYAAEYYINNELPAGQRDALLNGGGSYDDRVNALANLSANGMIQGAADYLQGE